MVEAQPREDAARRRRRQVSAPRVLRTHGCYGRLSLLDEQEVQERIDELIEQGWVEEHTPEDRNHTSLRLTREGRRTVAGVIQIAGTKAQYSKCSICGAWRSCCPRTSRADPECLID